MRIFEKETRASERAAKRIHRVNPSARPAFGTRSRPTGSLRKAPARSFRRKQTASSGGLAIYVQKQKALCKIPAKEPESNELQHLNTFFPPKTACRTCFQKTHRPAFFASPFLPCPVFVFWTDSPAGICFPHGRAGARASGPGRSGGRGRAVGGSAAEHPGLPGSKPGVVGSSFWTLFFFFFFSSF